jgi:hypothetical protein
LRNQRQACRQDSCEKQIHCTHKVPPFAYLGGSQMHRFSSTFTSPNSLIDTHHGSELQRLQLHAVSFT